MSRTFAPSSMLQQLPEQFFAKLAGTAAALKQEGHDVINLGQGNPDLPTPEHVVQSLQNAAEHPLYHKYSPFTGWAFLKEAVAAYYKREHGVTLDPETEVAVLSGAKTGLVEISQCLLNPGDRALLPDPGYPDYLSGTSMAGADVTFMPLKQENQFLPDFGQLNSSVLDEAKLMFLNYPNNPTAAVANSRFFEETVSLAERHDLCVCHDFAYGTIGFEEKPVSFLETPGAKDIGVEMFTMSKAFNMAGWRVGFAVGNASVIKHLNLLQDHLYVSLFGAVQHAAADALNGPQDSVLELTATYKKRRDLLISGLRDAGWEVPAPAGSFFAWLPVPNGWTSETFADKLLHEAHVVTAPGSGFGPSGEGFLRVGLVQPEERIQEAVERISKLDVFQP
ncbi:pyridoxal phosphate-dependent aminotransferase [Bacillus daqingensis]|uniref:Pyridoxal phosphate-dependent aminotransferase n=1 Tax=Bacillus daqingensis TaxID=872396 RepID=A0ABV9NX02_9BACI